MNPSEKEREGEREDFAFALTLPAFFSIVLYASSLIMHRANPSRGIDIFELSFLCGIVGVITSITCLLLYRFRTRDILVCQILNILWLVYIIYGIAFLGPLQLQG